MANLRKKIEWIELVWKEKLLDFLENRSFEVLYCFEVGRF